MAQLAIKGHTTRGREVIELLEMLGGKNINNLKGENQHLVYIIKNSYGKDIHCSWEIPCGYMVFTLERFLEKFPYKVGDKVQHKGATSCGSVFEIEKMRWMDNHVEYTIKRLWYNNCHTTVKVEDLQTYKEETNMKPDCKKCGLHYGSARCFDMDYCPYNQPKSNAVGLKDGQVIECEVNKEPDMVDDDYCETLDNKTFGYKVGDFIFTKNTGWIRITNKLWDCYAKDYTYKGIGWINAQEYDNISHKDITDKIELDKVADKNNCDINCPDGYAFYDYNGNLIGNKIIMKQTKPQYPKDYEECCEILDILGNINIEGYKKELLLSLQQLLIYRDAYWKIYGEQMGLDKPWKPDWNDVCDKHTIYGVYGNEIWRDKGQTINTLLAFPTMEMRDTFYNNFKELIEECKELL